MYLRNDIWWTRVIGVCGTNIRMSLETSDRATAAACDAWLTDLRNRLDRSGVLAAVIRRELTPAQAFSLGETAAAAWLEQQRATEQDWHVPDAMLDAWERATVKSGVRARTAAVYRWQVEQLWPAPRRKSWLTASTIRAALRALTCGEATKSRYRAALSSFVGWMLEEDLLETNPMTAVPGFAQSAVRDLWYTRDDARRLLSALPEPYRSAEAVLYACGWEWGAIPRATAKDLDLDALTAAAHGTKNVHRDRLTVITDLSVLPYLRDVKAGKLPHAPLWPDLRGDTCLKVHQATCRDLGLPVTTLHDWRHTFAVNNLKDGRSLQFVAQMLGHSNTTQVQTRYGRHVLSVGEVQSVARELAAQWATQKRDAM